MGILPGVANSQAMVLDPSDTVPEENAVATDLQCVLPPTSGVAAATKPTPEVDNRFEELGGNASPGPATKTRHTLLLHLRLTLKMQATKRELYKRTHFGTRLSRQQNGPYS